MPLLTRAHLDCSALTQSRIPCPRWAGSSTDMATGQPSVNSPSLRLSSQAILGCVKLSVKAVLLLGMVGFLESLLASESLLTFIAI